MTTMIIKAAKVDGGYRMIDEEGNYPQEGKTHKSAQSLYRDCAAMYPANSTWQGEKVAGGYQIVID